MAPSILPVPVLAYSLVAQAHQLCLPGKRVMVLLASVGCQLFCDTILGIFGI